MKTLPSFFSFVLGASVLVAACSSSSSSDESAGTKALGTSCEHNTDCAPSSGKVVRCMCVGSGSQKCTALLEPGEKCSPAGSSSVPCREGPCIASSPSLDDGTCPVMVESGEACGAGTACRDGACEQGTCSQPKAVGEKCGTDRECAAPAHCSENACRSPRHEGESCSPRYVLGSSREQCGVGMQCMASRKCGKPKADGQPCTDLFDCASLSCHAGTCGPPDPDLRRICL